MKVLIVDDQRSARLVLRKLLAAIEGLELLEASSAVEALAVVAQASPDLLLLDARLSPDPRDRGGLGVLRRLRESGNSVYAVMVTSLTELAEVREAMRSGANDYVLKEELSPEMLVPIVDGFRERLTLRNEVASLRERVEQKWGVTAIVGSSPAMESVRRLVLRVAEADATVLIRGETGTGKELVARALHEASSRRDRPFVPVNCSALPGPLIESLIFGHERGAFTGADRRSRGQFDVVGSGTLLLDEIAEMPSELQAKLLRVLEDRTFRPLGAEADVPFRARVVAATHVDLEQRIADGRFRADLYYRLNVVSVRIPSLSDREEDIPGLVQTFASKLTRKLRFTDEAIRWLTRRRWPGNVRELKNAVERLTLLADGEWVDVPALEAIVGASSGDAFLEIDRLAQSLLSLPDRLGSKLDVIERIVLHHAVEASAGNKSAAARLVGVDRKVFERRLERLSEPGHGGRGSGQDDE